MTMTKQEELDIKLMEHNLMREKLEFEEVKAQWKYNEDERNMLRALSWPNDDKNQEQERTRRSIEVCINVLRNSTSVFGDTDISEKAKKLATLKLEELIPKLG